MKKFGIPGVTVLVVDDDGASRSLLSRLLTVMGAAAVHEASSGEDAIRQIFSGTRPHLIICDVGMELIDGMAVLGALRASTNARIAAIPFIIFTASHDQALMTRALQIGATGVIPKPFNPQDFSEYLFHVVNRHVTVDHTLH
jgi:two-component system chemotaxis response regulator CheY